MLSVLTRKLCLFSSDAVFLRAKAAMLSARLSHRNSVCPYVRHTGGSVKTVQARIAKFSRSAARKTLVSGTVKLFHKFEGGHSERGAK